MSSRFDIGRSVRIPFEILKLSLPPSIQFRLPFFGVAFLFANILFAAVWAVGVFVYCLKGSVLITKL